MTLPLVLLRPEPGWSQSAAVARDMGLTVAGHPLFDIEPLDWTASADGCDSLLVGSANVFRAGGPGLARLRALPVHCVGTSTASAAREAGFVVGRVGHGGLQALIDRLAAPQRLLRLAGEERVALSPPPGIELAEAVVYRALGRPLALPSLPERAVVALHSAAAAQRFAAEVDRLRLPRAAYHLCAIGLRVAQAAGSGWASVQSVHEPHDAGLLVLARRMCQTVGRTRGEGEPGSRNG